MTSDAANQGSVAREEMGRTRRKKAAMSPPQRRRRAWQIIYRHMALSGTVGLMPAPFVDQVVIGGLLAKMLHDLFALYGIEVTEHKVKTVVAAVLGGAHVEWISRYALSYLNRYVLGFHRIGTIVIRPMMAAATTYAVGFLFVHHLDRGAWPAKELTAAPLESLPPP